MWKKVLGGVVLVAGGYLLKKYLDSKDSKSQDSKDSNLQDFKDIFMKKDFTKHDFNYKNTKNMSSGEIAALADTIKEHTKLYVIGDTNAGKSTLINRLMQRNVGSEKATDSIEITRYDKTARTYSSGWRPNLGYTTMYIFDLVELKCVDSEFIKLSSNESDIVCYVFNANAFSIESLESNMDMLVPIAKEKNMRFRILGSHEASLSTEAKKQMLDSIKSLMSKYYDKCEIYDDSGESSDECEKSGGGYTSTWGDINVYRAPYPKDSPKCKIAIFELLQNRYNSDASTNATLLKSKLIDFLDYKVSAPPIQLWVG